MQVLLRQNLSYDHEQSQKTVTPEVKLLLPSLAGIRRRRNGLKEHCDGSVFFCIPCAGQVELFESSLGHALSCPQGVPHPHFPFDVATVWPDKLALSLVPRAVLQDTLLHTPSLVFWQLPPNSAITGYTVEGTLLISAYLSISAVSTLCKVWIVKY